jgi:hypothetical protein
VVTAHDPLRMKRERLQEQAVPDIGRRDFFDLRRVSSRGDRRASRARLREGAEAVLPGKSRVQRTLRVVLEGRWSAEHGDDRIPGELLDRTTR